MKLEKEEIFVLKMNFNQVLWLKGIMQNPLYGVSPEDENQTDKMHRKEFWQTISETIN